MNENMNRYRYRKVEYVAYVLLYAVILFALGWIFTHSLFFSTITASLTFLFVEEQRGRLDKKYHRHLLRQFRDFIEAMNASLKASAKPLELCFEDALVSMEQIYSEKDRLFLKLKRVDESVRTNRNYRLPDKLMEMAEELHDADVKNFVGALQSCYGRNICGISKVIQSTASLIEEKRRVEEEIATQNQAMRMEQMIMLSVPSVFLIFLGYSMTDYTELLYKTPAGRVVSLICLAINIGAYFFGNYVTKQDAA